MKRFLTTCLVSAGLIMATAVQAAPCDPAAPSASPSCWPGTGKRVDGHRARFAGFEAVVDDSLPGQVADFALKRVLAVLYKAHTRDAVAARRLAEVKRVEIAASSTGNRFVGWRRSEPGVMVISIGSFLDKTPDVLIGAIARVARESDGGGHGDPLVRRIGSLRLEGSAYPDVDNRPFFTTMERVMAKAKTLPEGLRRYVDAVDAIHYVPRSKSFAKVGPMDPAVALYNTRLSEEGNRRIFVHRNMKWNSEIGLLLLLVHEGTHAVQHATAGRYEKNLPAQQAALKRMGPEAPERDDVRRKVRHMETYLANWNGNDKDDRGISERMRFECEATVHEIQAAKALDAPPELVDDSLYLQHCDEASALLARWRDQRLADGLRKAKAAR